MEECPNCQFAQDQLQEYTRMTLTYNHRAIIK